MTGGQASIPRSMITKHSNYINIKKEFLNSITVLKLETINHCDRLAETSPILMELRLLSRFLGRLNFVAHTSWSEAARDCDTIVEFVEY